METRILEEIIVGRVEPHIYAFSTKAVSGSLKVGDTYRPVAVRLGEWREHYPDLRQEFAEPARIEGQGVYFRDFSVHDFLETCKHRHRLRKDEFPPGVACSTEFFREATAADVEEAVVAIKNDYLKQGGKYQFYDAETRLPETYAYARTADFEPRPNQQEAIAAFRRAVNAGRTNLLMYAVMRFGKSFTSLCCALDMEARVVLVVSGKADVKEEWKRTVESHVKFAAYDFLDALDLDKAGIMRQKLDAGRRLVVFLTLQDLQGDDIKERHREVFDNRIDLLIVDETHFGARAEKYGQVLQGLGTAERKATQGSLDDEDYVDCEEADGQLKTLNARVRLHLSGTPYRILMGSEFTPEDIVAFCQFSDIVDAQEAWNRAHALDDGLREWDNPYFGFPQMVRFAFRPNRASRQRLKELREQGVSCAFSALLKPKSLKRKDEELRRKFICEQEVLELLEVIDGSRQDDELFGFLDYDKIKSGQMCHHMVMVLPFCASCDAMEKLIHDHRERFRNLKDYEILNISGLDERKEFRNARQIKERIRQAEAEGRKTLTLTVNRMLTGSTVEEWDTMLFLKDTASPQEYDQAIFRLQNAYVKRYEDRDGHELKLNLKPQTLLVDFDPDRMFAMQENKAQIYNANVDEAGNSRLLERLEKELRISPVIAVNAGKMRQVEATDVMDAVREYARNRGVADVTREIPVDLALLRQEEIRQAIARENELGSKAGLTIQPAEGREDELETPDGTDGNRTDDGKPDGNRTDDGKPDGNRTDDGKPGGPDPVKQFRSYYARILFFAFLTKDQVRSLEELIVVLDRGENPRIASHVGISKAVLVSIQEHINVFVLRELDYRIQNLNQLARDESLPPLERAQVAVRKFGRLGESEIITPQKVCEDMVALIPEDGFRQVAEHGHKFLDIAGKAGEFALSIYRRLVNLGYGIEEIRDAIYTIPTSGLAYEFTRMIYQILGLNADNIAERFTSYDLLEVRDASGRLSPGRVADILSQARKFNDITTTDTIVEGEDKVFFEAVVGNPPYQVAGGSGGTNDAPIYQDFIWIAQRITCNHFSFITPSRWFSGGREHLLGPFREEMLKGKMIHDMKVYMDSHDLFPDVEIKGGLCYFSGSKNYSGDCNYCLVQNGCEYASRRKLEEFDVLIREPLLAEIVKKTTENATHFISEIISGDTPFGIPTNPQESKKNPVEIYDSRATQHDVKLFYIKGSKRKISYVSYDRIRKNISAIRQEKVFIPKGYGAGETYPHQILGIPEYGGKRSVCSQSYLYAAFETKQEATNFMAYIHARFFRALVSSVKISQDAMSKTYRFVPMQDFTSNSDIDWSRSVSDIDRQLYDKYGLSEEERQFIEEKIKPME